MQRPLPAEHPPFFSNYIGLVGDGEFFALLQQNTEDTLALFGQLPADKHNYAYAPGKWTVKEILMHIVDTERVMSYRALAAARGDSASALPSMDQNVYARGVDVTNRSMDSLLEEFKAVRSATYYLLANLTDAQTKLTAALPAQPTTVRSLAYIIVGHVQHHMHVLSERYL